jgi:ABC-type Fe3+ transport system substrate-binding protein
MHRSNGFGVLGIVTDPPRPNAAEALLNWFISKEGQESYRTALGIWTWTRNGSSRSPRRGKDTISSQDYQKYRNHLEDKHTKILNPAEKICREY